MTVLREASDAAPEASSAVQGEGDGEPSAPSIDDLAPLLRDAVAALDAVADDIALPGLPSEAVLLAEAVSTARAALYTELIRQGWVAPEQVPEGVKIDELLLAEQVGAAYDHRPSDS